MNVNTIILGLIIQDIDARIDIHHGNSINIALEFFKMIVIHYGENNNGIVNMNAANILNVG